MFHGLDRRKNTVNPNYTDESILCLRLSIAKSVVTTLSMPGAELLPNVFAPKILVSENGVEFGDFDKDEMNSVRSALVVLGIIDVLRSNNGKYSKEALTNMIVVPEAAKYSNQIPGASVESGDTNYIDSIVYLLTKAFFILMGKLQQRPTPLFQLLFLKTCLLLEREGVPANHVLGTSYGNINWFTFSRTYLVHENEPGDTFRMDKSGFQKYPTLFSEVLGLYAELFLERDQK